MNKVYVFENHKYLMEFKRYVKINDESVPEYDEIMVSKHPDLAEQCRDRIARKFDDGTLNIKN